MPMNSTSSSHKRHTLSSGTGRYRIYGDLYAFMPTYYPGLKVRQLGRAGRIVLDEVINDRPAYWFVTLLNAKAEDQALLRQHFGPRFGGGRILGNRRFVDLADAREYFEALCQIPKFAAEIERRGKVKAERKERLESLQSTLKMYSTPPTRTSPIQKSEDSGRVKHRTTPVASLEKEKASGRVEYQGTPTPFLNKGTFDLPEAFTGQSGGLVKGPEGSQT
jgi:hypothetical protein